MQIASRYDLTGLRAEICQALENLQGGHRPYVAESLAEALGRFEDSYLHQPS